MAFVCRVFLDVSGIREALTLAYAKKIGHAFAKPLLQ